MKKNKEVNLATDHKALCNSLGIKVNSKRYRRYANAGLLDNLDEEYVNEIQEYWNKHYNKSVDPILHLAMYNLTGKKDVRIIPGTEMWYDFIPYFNDRCMVAGYKDKNIYDILFETSNAPCIILKSVRGHYFDNKNSQLSDKEAEKVLINSDYNSFIIKPSNTNNGVGIELLEINAGKIYLKDKVVSINGLSEIYDYNFIVQEVIQQHEIMKRPHPSSVNTLRMVTQRWNNKIEYLLTFARFGTDNAVKDNAGTGGICIGVKENGEFLNYAVDEDCNTYKQHPTTNYSFKEMPPIPNFDKFIDFVRELHKDILHMDFVSWDVAVGKSGEPIFIEANFAGATWLYQFATGIPIYGDLTEEIVEHVKLNNGIKRDVGTNIGKLRRNNRRLRRNNRKIKLEKKRLETQLDNDGKKLQNLEHEIDRQRTINTNLLNSKSWKITKPLRRIKDLVNK